MASQKFRFPQIYSTSSSVTAFSLQRSAHFFQALFQKMLAFSFDVINFSKIAQIMKKYTNSRGEISPTNKGRGRLKKNNYGRS